MSLSFEECRYGNLSEIIEKVEYYTKELQNSMNFTSTIQEVIP